MPRGNHHAAAGGSSEMWPLRVFHATLNHRLTLHLGNNHHIKTTALYIPMTKVYALDQEELLCLYTKDKQRPDVLRLPWFVGRPQ